MDRNDWEARYASKDYSPREYPSELLTDYVDWAPDGKAVEVATGTGRNALFLAEEGYEVDALDISRNALRIASDSAQERKVDVNWIQADADEFSFQTDVYDIAIVSFYYNPSLIPKLITALKPGGVLIYEHHVQTKVDVERGPSDEYRYRSNDLLRYCLGLTILSYQEAIRTFESGDRAGTRGAIASLVAQKSTDAAHPHPPEPSPRR